MCEDRKYKHPFTCIVSVPRGSRKSSICIRFLQNLETVCTVHKSNGGVILCYSKQNAVPSRQLAGTKYVRFNEVVPADFDIAKKKQCFIILGDLLNEAYSNDLCDLFLKGSNHSNISSF